MKPDRTFKSMLPPGEPVEFWYLCGECGARTPMKPTPEEALLIATKGLSQKKSCSGCIYDDPEEDWPEICYDCSRCTVHADLYKKG